MSALAAAFVFGIGISATEATDLRASPIRAGHHRRLLAG